MTPITLTRRTLCGGLLNIAASAAVLGSAGCSSGQDAIAATSSGKIRGSRAGTVLSFKGVPYGSAKDRRFMRAAAPQPWTGIRDALAYGPMSPQPAVSYAGGRVLQTSWRIPQQEDEDCLALNIWTSALRTSKKRPVMVWIHGGGFYYGSGASTVYDGSRLVERGDVVVVTLNHRLNVFGHLYLGAATRDERFADSGNIALCDIIDALRWIRENIAEFGGDPGSVTVFGVSGGGQKICCLLAMPEARGLFHRAVVQSGPYVTARTIESAAATTDTLLRHLGIDARDPARLNVPSTDAIQSAYRQLPATMFLELGPVVDGGALPRHPFTPDAPSLAADVPLLIGITKTETTYILGTNERYFALDWPDLPLHLGPYLRGADVADVIAKYRAILPGASPSDLFFDITTQLIMGRNSQAIADLKSAQRRAPVYFYQLGWPLPIDNGRWRSPHVLDIPLVFDNVAAASSMFGTAQAQAQRMADMMSDAWLAFARTGDPDAGSRLGWPSYDSAARKVLNFDIQPAVLDNPFERRLQVLAEAGEWDGPRPFRIRPR